MYANLAGQVKELQQPIAPILGGMAATGVRHAEAQEACQAARSGLQQLLVAQLLDVRESEQKRIATDLHDVLGQSLTMIRLSVDEAQIRLAGNEAGETARLLQRLALMVENAMGELHHVAMNLRPPMLDDIGILATLSWFFRELEKSSRGIRVEQQINISENSIPASLRVTIFRIIQEAVNNIIKHAHADCISVELKKNRGSLLLSIKDDGAGFSPERHSMGLGLLSMKERAENSGGRFLMKSAPGQGTQIKVSWPLENWVSGTSPAGASNWQYHGDCHRPVSQAIRTSLGV